MNGIITEKTLYLQTIQNNSSNLDKSRLADFQQSELFSSVALEPTEYAASSVNLPSELVKLSTIQSNQGITYQNLLDSGLPLGRIAKLCGLSHVRGWKSQGIPPKFQSKLAQIFVKHKVKYDRVETTSSLTPMWSTAHLPPAKAVQNLGILPNNPNPLLINDLQFLDLPVFTNEQIAVYDSQMLRYLRQNAARRLLPNERVCKCLRKTTRIDVSVKREFATGRAYFTDLFVCGGVRTCAVCATKISEKRAEEGRIATRQHRKQWGNNSILFVTFTYPHHREDVLKDLFEKQQKAFHWLFDNWDFRAWCEKNGYVGNIRALDITHGDNNGWHPHVHYLIFFERNFEFLKDDNGYPISKADGIRPIKNFLHDLWASACEQVGLGFPTLEHGVDVKDGQYASDYVCGKWGMEEEVFKTAVKKGRMGAVNSQGERVMSFSPFQLLDLYIAGDVQAGQLFVEYIDATKGSRQQRWSKGLKARFKLKEISDQQAAIGEDRAAYLFAMIPAEDWAIIDKKSPFNYSLRANIVFLASLGDVVRFWRYINFLCGREINHGLSEETINNGFIVPVNAYDTVLNGFNVEQYQLPFEPIEIRANSIKSTLETVYKPFKNAALNYDLFGYDNEFLDSQRSGKYKDHKPLDVLKTVFQYDNFRGLQGAAVEHITAGGSALVLMATGAGKSLCFQIPMLCRGGVGVVISPLKSLMRDQITALRAKGINAELLNSDLSEKQIERVEQRIIAGGVDILYISPERLSQPKTLDFLALVPVSLFAIDEAHCISQWGHDFRADYLAVQLLADKFPYVPRVALTATADKATRDDIIQFCGLGMAKVFTTDFDRKNIEYSVFRSKNISSSIATLLDFVTTRKNQTGIVYCSSRQKVEDVTKLLIANGVDALSYHSGMKKSEREHNQAVFIARSVVVVATIAFGMGIDKPDVRYVVHLDLSASVEAFYQESGRAGRDGLQAESLVIYNAKTSLARVRHMSESERLKFSQVQYYCELEQAELRPYLLSYFM